jgi:ubiquinone/menaquinone biosynthesis C-methylase UbiE
MKFLFRKKQTGQESAGPKTDVEKVDKYWADSPSLEEKRLIAWMEHPRILRYINSRTTGDPIFTWFPYVVQKYIPVPVSRALSLGCGTGGLERHGLSIGAAEMFDAIDISSGSIDEARSTAQQLGLESKVNYKVGNLNKLQLGHQEYDVVFASMSVHHVEALEALCTQICRTLRDGGYFICNEYIGPNRFQLSAERLQIINKLLSLLPARYRRIIRNSQVTSEIKTLHQNPPLAWFDEYDPSESVRSADIMSVIRQYFHIVEYRPYGGSLLHFLLQNIVGNFQDGQEEDDAWLDTLTYFEQLLEEKCVVDSDFALIVATPIKPG